MTSRSCAKVTASSPLGSHVFRDRLPAGNCAGCPSRPEPHCAALRYSHPVEAIASRTTSKRLHSQRWKPRCGTLYDYDLFAGSDVGHSLILGSTGAGKSFLLNFLLVHVLRYNPRVCILDLGGSYRYLTAMLGGSYLRLDGTTTGKPVLVVLNATAASGQDTLQAERALSAHQVETCPVKLGRRIAFARALVSGQAAQEFQPSSKAAREIQLLHSFVLERLQGFDPADNGKP